ncbi:peptidylprolyl isomerase [soil metagenome]
MNKFITVILTFILVSSCAQSKTDMVVTIKTSYGEMVAVLYDETPKHKENFLKLAESGFYNGLSFHRVIQGFMLQTGDSSSRTAKPGEPLGMKGKGYTLTPEFNPKYYHQKGALSAARMPDDRNPKKESSGSQFFIVQGTIMTPEEIEVMTYNVPNIMAGLRQMFEKLEYKPMLDSLNRLYYSGNMAAYKDRIIELSPTVEKVTGLKVKREMDAVTEQKLKIYSTLGGAANLDGDYTVFGQVIKGLDVIDKIAAVQRDERDRPLDDVYLNVTVKKMSRKKITKEYGYVFPEQTSPTGK